MHGAVITFKLWLACQGIGEMGVIGSCGASPYLVWSSLPVAHLDSQDLNLELVSVQKKKEIEKTNTYIVR